MSYNLLLNVCFGSNRLRGEFFYSKGILEKASNSIREEYEVL